MIDVYYQTSFNELKDSDKCIRFVWKDKIEENNYLELFGL